MQNIRINSFETISKTAASLLFVLFTVFTSCTARQWLNASTDMELSKTFNSNKSTTTAFEACATFLEEAKMTSEVNMAQTSPALAVLLLCFIGFFLFPNKWNTIPYFLLPAPFKSRPLYILYSKRKILN